MDNDDNLRAPANPTSIFTQPLDFIVHSWSPVGSPACLEGNTYFVSAELGPYQNFTVERVRDIITRHRGVIGTTRTEEHRYVIGSEPDPEFMESILGFDQITQRELWDEIDGSLFRADMEIDRDDVEFNDEEEDMNTTAQEEYQEHGHGEDNDEEDVEVNDDEEETDTVVQEGYQEHDHEEDNDDEDDVEVDDDEEEMDTVVQEEYQEHDHEEDNDDEDDYDEEMDFYESNHNKGQYDDADYEESEDEENEDEENEDEESGSEVSDNEEDYFYNDEYDDDSYEFEEEDDDDSDYE